MEKTYVGNAKTKELQYGTILCVSFSRADLETMTANLNEAGWINLNIGKRKEVSQYGHTHSITIDTWKPTQGESQSYTPNNAPQVAPPMQQGVVQPPPQAVPQAPVQQAMAQATIPNGVGVNGQAGVPMPASAVPADSSIPF